MSFVETHTFTFRTYYIYVKYYFNDTLFSYISRYAMCNTCPERPLFICVMFVYSLYKLLDITVVIFQLSSICTELQDCYMSDVDIECLWHTSAMMKCILIARVVNRCKIIRHLQHNYNTII